MSEKTFRIGEAATILNLKTYVLRFWEMEFPQISPLRTDKGQRLYTEADIELLRRIRYLLHERGLTIEGARRILQEETEAGKTSVIVTDLPLSLIPPDLAAAVSGKAKEGAAVNEAGQGEGSRMMTDQSHPVRGDSPQNTTGAEPLGDEGSNLSSGPSSRSGQEPADRETLSQNRQVFRELTRELVDIRRMLRKDDA